MDWSTVILSTAVSGIVGTLVSLAAVSQTTVRQRRAERRDEARLALADAVSPLRADLRLFEIGVRGGDPRRTVERSHVDDHRLATRVLDTTRHMAAWRRALVRRRCKRVFGGYWTTLADEMPYTEASAIVPALVGAPRLTDAGVLRDSPVRGLYHRALVESPGHMVQKELRRELRLLEAGW